MMSHSSTATLWQMQTFPLLYATLWGVMLKAISKLKLWTVNLC